MLRPAAQEQIFDRQAVHAVGGEGEVDLPFVGAAVLGGFISSLLWPMYLAGWPDADLRQIFLIVQYVFSSRPVSSWLMVSSCSVLSLWSVWMLVARPWRRAGGPPAARQTGVKKPW